MHEMSLALFDLCIVSWPLTHPPCIPPSPRTSQRLEGGLVGNDGSMHILSLEAFALWFFSRPLPHPPCIPPSTAVGGTRRYAQANAWKGDLLGTPLACGIPPSSG